MQRAKVQFFKDYFELFFPHKNIKKLPSKVVNNRLGWAVLRTANQPISHILFHKCLTTRDLYSITMAQIGRLSISR